MLKPHDKLTLIRNRHRARELRLFRDLVEAYFDRSQRDTDDVPLDWEGARAARSRINQMLPRIIQIVRAAGLGGSATVPGATDPGLSLGRVDVIPRIFSAREGDGLDQEIVDVIDMALGVYEADRLPALIRTVNPIHYAATALGFLARGPRRLLAGLGFRGRQQTSGLGAVDIPRLEQMATRLDHVEESMEDRLAGAQDRQALRLAEYQRQLSELAERLDFTERVLAQRAPQEQLPPPSRQEISTPV